MKKSTPNELNRMFGRKNFFYYLEYQSQRKSARWDYEL